MMLILAETLAKARVVFCQAGCKLDCGLGDKPDW